MATVVDSRMSYPQHAGEDGELIGFNATGEGVYFDSTLGMHFALTSCCQAARTGVCITDANPLGLACKGCYQPVSEEDVVMVAWNECSTCGEMNRDYWTVYCGY